MEEAQGRLEGGLPDDKEIASVQVLFPDRKTLDEVIAELRNEIENLKSGETEAPSPTTN